MKPEETSFPFVPQWVIDALEIENAESPAAIPPDTENPTGERMAEQDSTGRKTPVPHDTMATDTKAAVTRQPDMR